jgi:hypothetical protein
MIEIRRFIMKRAEITYTRYQRELEKLNARLERAEAAYEKKLATARKYGVENWTSDDRRAWSETVETTQTGFFINKEDEKINMAWWNLTCAESEIEDIKNAIERAEKRLEKSENEVIKYRAELDKIADLKAKEEFAKKEFEEEQKEWAKDGITLEDRYCGLTPTGKRFVIYGNNYGFTNRSLHCFTLRIDGKTIFTSGEFWRAYAVIKRN